jgi:hypothetical protein
VYDFKTTSIRIGGLGCNDNVQRRFDDDFHRTYKINLITMTIFRRLVLFRFIEHQVLRVFFAWRLSCYEAVLPSILTSVTEGGVECRILIEIKRPQFEIRLLSMETYRLSAGKLVCMRFIVCVN